MCAMDTSALLHNAQKKSKQKTNCLELDKEIPYQLKSRTTQNENTTPIMTTK